MKTVTATKSSFALDAAKAVLTEVEKASGQKGELTSSTNKLNHTIKIQCEESKLPGVQREFSRWKWEIK